MTLGPLDAPCSPKLPEEVEDDCKEKIKRFFNAPTMPESRLAEGQLAENYFCGKNVCKSTVWDR
jgi:hypothetical protein